MDRNDLPLPQFVAAIADNLFTAVVSDVLDELGYRDQAFPAWIRPLDDERTLVGFARTGVYREVYQTLPDENPYELEIALVDDLKPYDVAVFGCGGSKRIAPWGELLSTAARARGASGAVIDGLVRDVRKIEELGFPVFASGIKPVDSMGRGVVTAYNVPVECGEVLVHPGDFVFADFDGVVVVPRAMVKQTLELAADKVRRENHSRAELMEGAFLRDVFAKYGVL
jgi:4-hydroxy-4-methyl-2-oxoglutarate aldolase